MKRIHLLACWERYCSSCQFTTLGVIKDYGWVRTDQIFSVLEDLIFPKAPCKQCDEKDWPEAIVLYDAQANKFLNRAPLSELVVNSYTPPANLRLIHSENN